MQSDQVKEANNFVVYAIRPGMNRLRHDYLSVYGNNLH